MLSGGLDPNRFDVLILWLAALWISFVDRKAAWECSVISGVSLSTVKDSMYALGQEAPCTNGPLNQGERGKMPHVYGNNQVSRGYQSIFVAEAKTL